MTKEEILEMSRKDNASGDEREKQTHRNASSASYILGLFLCILIQVANRYFDGPKSVDAVASLIWASMFALNTAYLGKQLNDRFYKFAAVITTLDAVFSFVMFIYTLSHGI